MEILYKIIGIISLAFTAFLGIFFVGKRSGSEKEKQKNSKELLDAISQKVKIKNNVARLSDDELVKRLQEWGRDTD